MRYGGGVIVAVFGLPFFCAGIFVILVGLGFVPVDNPATVPAWASPLLALVGLAFMAVGASLVFSRNWITLDSTQRVVEKEWGLLVPMRTRTHRLDDYTSVMLRFVQGDSDTADQFPVSLKSRAGADLPLCSSTQYGESRTWASDIARYLRLAIEDATTDHPRAMSPEDAERPLQQRLQRAQEQEPNAERPSTARSDVTEEIGSVRIVIPVPRRHPAVLTAMLIPAAVPLVVAGPFAQFFRQTRTPEPVAWVFQGFLILMFGILPGMVALNAFLRSRFGRTTVTISASGIRIEERGAWKTKTIASLRSSEIIDVDYGTADSLLGSARRDAERRVLQSRGTPPVGPVVSERTERILTILSRFAKGRGVTLKTRQGLTSFGQGLADEEIRYLHAIVRRALVLGAVSRPGANRPSAQSPRGTPL